VIPPDDAQRARGAYFTPSAAADALAHWALRDNDDGAGNLVLEPSMGDGELLDALAREAARTGVGYDPWGVELDSVTFAATVARCALRSDRAFCADFLEIEPFPVDAVVANPPYVRLRHLPTAPARRAQQVAAEVLGAPMESSGSVWMPFVLHATRFLRAGGRLAVVLPHDLTYVRYARPLWRYLGASFSSLRVVRVRQRMFPELLQEVVLLFADGWGGNTDSVRFDAHASLDGLAEPDQPLGSVSDGAVSEGPVSADVPLAAVLSGDRVFVEALLPEAARLLMDGAVRTGTRPARELVTFNIGYVTGDKAFFHPEPTAITRHGLRAGGLLRALTSSRQVSGTGLRTSSIPPDRLDHLFRPRLPLGDGEAGYVAMGHEQGVSQRYKCRIREPWFVTPGVRVPDVVVPVFTERPAMMINDAGLIASNSLLCGYLRPEVVAGDLVAGWYTSLTLLQLEMHVHALGGGVMVVVPGEAGRVRLPVVHGSPAHLRRIDGLLCDGRADAAFEAGDRAVLVEQLGLSEHDVAVIREAAAVLRAWRTTSRGDSGRRGSDAPRSIGI
jgi:adenine-specific DNA-methyltransferase